MVRHPLIDDVVGPAIVVDSSAPVVWLTDSLDSLLRRAEAAGRHRRCRATAGGRRTEEERAGRESE